MKLTGDRCRCGACGEYFNSTRAFDKHRVGPYESRSCMTAEQMREKGMDVNARGFWITARNMSLWPALPA